MLKLNKKEEGELIITAAIIKWMLARDSRGNGSIVKEF